MKEEITLIRPHDDNGPNGVNAFPPCTLYKAHTAIIEVSLRAIDALISSSHLCLEQIAGSGALATLTLLPPARTE